MRTKQKGSFVIEAAIGIPILFMIIFTWIEYCILIYSMSMTDHAFTRAVMYAKKLSSGQNYELVAKNKMLEARGAYSYVIRENNVTINIRYFQDFSALSGCRGNDVTTCYGATNVPYAMPIAIYELKYLYQPLFSIWLPEIPIRREIMTIQEYQI
ncbi:pilus assembly protein TadE [Vibrio diazotrophicus]|uniref:Pilus assembly protein TadE n=1 Tax=Vibrio diazotrophicus TaxID=685 RepID=A0A2J8I4U0_VIBDI|nr:MULTISPECIES: TadE family protein [Vibrio]MCF7361904.1 pilus assembly protein [Vibrio sp. A1-b2]PNI05552.1 pilus assembly protein TadE [Vibrio diazotrophicus]